MPKSAASNSSSLGFSPSRFFGIPDLYGFEDSDMAQPLNKIEFQERTRCGHNLTTIMLVVATKMIEMNRNVAICRIFRDGKVETGSDSGCGPL
jgi:hypothetical protein